MSKLSADDVFRLHPKIRWTAYSTQRGEVIFSKMREGVESYTTNSDDRTFMELGILLVCEMAQRLSPTKSAGKLESVIVNLDKVSVLIMDHGEGHIAVSAERAGAFRVFEEVGPQIAQLPV